MVLQRGHECEFRETVLDRRREVKCWIEMKMSFRRACDEVVALISSGRDPDGRIVTPRKTE